MYIDTTSALHVAVSRIHSSQVLHVHLWYLSIQELVVKEGRIGIDHVKSEGQPADIGIKHFSKHRHQFLIKLIGEFRASTVILCITNNRGATGGFLSF